MKKITLTLTTLLFMTSFSSFAEESLLSTYQRELAFLMAQKRTLTKQSKLIKKEYGQKVKLAERELKKSQDSLVAVTKQNELLGSKLMDAERGLENVENANSLLDTTLTQAKVSLEINDESWDLLKNNESKIKTILSGALTKLIDGGEVRSTNMDFFTISGKLVKGETLKLGRIAAFGTYEGMSSALMPVGLGKLKMTEVDLSREVSALKAKSELNSLPLFIYESTSKGVEPKKEKSFMEIVEAGGSIAYVIVALGLVALVLALVRGFLLYTASRFDKNILKDLESGDIQSIESKVEKQKTPFDRVLGKTLASRDKDREARENVIHESILGELNFLDKFGAIILVMAAVAPLLGLLGTVTGMISTFDIITEFGTGDPKLLSSGISEALITTKLGLVVAIPSLLLGNLLGGWSGKIKVMLEREALRLSNKFDKDSLNA